MRKVAVLGGTFDPIHNGHIELAKTVIRKLHVDEVWFMPTLLTPLKNRQLTSFVLRKKMIQAAIAPYRKMKISLLEASLPTPSYTINTVLELKKRYPNTQFYWIIGDDQAKQLNHWKEIERLKQEVQFVCVARGEREIENQADLIQIRDFNVPISSTEVRKGNWNGVPKSVRRIMINNALYLDEVVFGTLSKRRAQHCLSVCDVALQLAKAHHVDLIETKIASILHDISKELSLDEAKRVMEILHPEYCDMNPKIWHAWLGEDWIAHHLGITEEHILSSVAHHVLGDGKSKLDKILFIADKIDPGRGYDISKQLALSIKDLDRGLALVKSQQKHYLKEVDGIE